MNTISIVYSLKWQLKNNTNYQFTHCKKCFNVSRGKQIRMVLNGGSLGFWIAGKFMTLNNIKNNIELIPKKYCPF